MRLPADLSGQQLRRASERIGFVYQRQKGSHMILRRDDPYSRVIVPDHRTIRPGTLRQILYEAGVTVEQLKQIL